MSSIQLEDGGGTSRKALVDDHGRLYTKANVISHMSHHATYHNNGFVGVFDTTLPDGNATPCLHMENTNNGKEFELYWFRVSADAAVEIKVYIEQTRSSGGSVLTLNNTYAGHGNISNISTYEGGASADLVVDSTNAKVIDGAFIGANTPVNFEYEGGIVIPFGRNFSVEATGATGDKVKIMLGIAMHNVGTIL